MSVGEWKHYPLANPRSLPTDARRSRPSRELRFIETRQTEKGQIRRDLLAKCQIRNPFPKDRGKLEAVTTEPCRNHDLWSSRDTVDHEMLIRRHGVEA